jgi:Skp family chaperone for outer membrane proteins
LAGIVKGKMKLLILGILILTRSVIYGQTTQGYIDYEKVMMIFPQYIDGQREIEKRAKQLNDSLVIIAKKIEASLMGCYSEKVARDSSFRKVMEDRINGLQKEMEHFQEYAKKEVIGIQNKVNTNLNSIIVTELKQFSDDNNWICVVDKKSILYCNDCRDFTDDFITYYKKRRK